MPVVEVDVLVDDAVLVVGPPALPAEAAIPMPAPARASTPMIIVVLISQVWALWTPAGLPGARTGEFANALEVQSASDIARQVAVFISIPLERTGRTLDQVSGSRKRRIKFHTPGGPRPHLSGYGTLPSNVVTVRYNVEKTEPRCFAIIPKS